MECKPNLWIQTGISTAVAASNSCTVCHSIHGSDNAIGVTYDELDITHEQEETTGVMGIARVELTESPLYCGLSVCHGSDPADTFFIFYPTGE